MKTLLCCLGLCLGFAVQAQTTSFTYQGVLNDNGFPANGIFDVRFAVYDAATGGNSLNAITNAAIGVTNGLFTVELDFGGSVFNGDPRWLEIGMRTNGAVAAHTILNPRQHIAPTPYAIRAESAINVTGTIPASSITGIIPDSRLSTNVVRLNGANLTLSGEIALGTGPLVYSGGAEVVDQVNEGTLFRAFNNFTIWQSFKVSRSGTLTGIDIQCGSASSFVNLEIRSGTGLNGMLLFSTQLDITGFPITAWRPVFTNGDIRVEAGQTLTFSLSSLDEMYWLYNDTDTYTNGVSSYSSDMSFRTYVKPDAFPPLFVVKNGHVGIGTTNPAATLHVEGDLRINGVIGNNLGVTGQPTPGLLGGTGDRLVLWPGTDFEPPYSHGIAPGTMWASVPSDGTFKWFAGSAERMRLGNLGNLSATSFSGNGAGLTNVSASNLAGNIGDTMLSTNIARLNANQQNFSGTNVFARVGIGAASPETALQVAGTIYTTKGVGLPTAGKVGGAGDRIVLSDGNASSPPYSIGINSLTMWLGIPTGARFEWYSNTNRVMYLDGNGNLYATALNPQSDRAAKENFATVDGAEVLEKVAALPISRWNYKTDTGTAHIGPMAQDFHAAFGVGTDDKHIATVDADGVALAAIQGLNQKLAAKDSEIQKLREEMQELRRVVEHLARTESNP